jgi:hypothetical protein
MHPAKICSTVLGPVPAKYTDIPVFGPQAHCDNTALLIHDLNWRPISCPVLRNESQMSLEAVLGRLEDSLSHLLLQVGSPKVKIQYIRFKIIPIAVATAQCSSWTLQQYRALDKPFSRAYRTLLALHPKCPETVLYLPSTDMGVGLPRFSDKAQLMKWQALLRCLAVGGAPCQRPVLTASSTDFLLMPLEKPETCAPSPHQRTGQDASR